VNLLLLQPEEMGPNGLVTLLGRRAEHVREVLRAQAGQTLRVGIKGGCVGTAVVQPYSGSSHATDVNQNHMVELVVTLQAPAPARPGIDVILAIPRPKALKRIIPALASLGVDSVFLVGATKVERSYFDSRVMHKAFIDGLIELGLEQAQDTIAPSFETHERLDVFFEHRLAKPSGETRILCHPNQGGPAVPHAGRLLVAVGPDGGWTDDEVALFTRHGFAHFSMGTRTLRVEVAVSAAIGALRPTLELPDPVGVSID
jgi:RsmE family RNA methyltransferase